MKLRTAALAMVLIAMGAGVQAQGYPTRPVRVIVPFPPGQATDIVARIIAEKLTQSMGQPFVIVNQPGAGGQIGTQTVTTAAADGYTLLGVGSGPVTVLPSLRKVPYDPLTQLTPVSMTAFVAFAVVTRPGFPATNVAELITEIKAHPDKYTYSSAGVGTTAHLTTEYFNSLAELKARHVVFNGSAASLNSIIGGQVDYTFDAIPALIGLLNGGRLNALGVSTLKRVSGLPDVPTVSESARGATPGFEMIAWLGYMAPPGLPADIAERLSNEIGKALKSPDVVERYKTLGMEPLWTTPADMGAMIRRDIERFGAVARKANIKLD